MKALCLLLLCHCALALEPAKPRDFSRVTDADIIKTVEHMQRLIRETEAQLDAAQLDNAALLTRVDVLVVDLGDARIAIEAWRIKDEILQAQLASAKDRVREARAAEKYQEGLAWKWRLITLALVVVVVGFFALRHYVPILKLL